MTTDVASQANMAGHGLGKAWRGVARLGLAWQGKAWRGRARDSLVGMIACQAAALGVAWFG